MFYTGGTVPGPVGAAPSTGQSKIFWEKSKMKLFLSLLTPSLLGLFGLLEAAVLAGDTPVEPDGKPQQAAKAVELFDAIDQGLIDVTLKHRNSLSGVVTVKNLSGEPLQVALPEAFAGIPVVAQFGDFGDAGDGGGGSRRSNRGDRGGRGGGGGNQMSGGGFGGTGMGMGMGGGMGGWNLGPDKVLKEEVKTVCLEHGKREPRLDVKYAVRPIEEATQNKEVQVLCSLVGSGQADQQSAQAAVWHLNNDISWDQLAMKTARRAGKRATPYFSSREMRTAVHLAATARKIAEKQNAEEPKTDGEYESIGQ